MKWRRMENKVGWMDLIRYLYINFLYNVGCVGKVECILCLVIGEGGV